MSNARNKTHMKNKRKKKWLLKIQKLLLLQE